MIRLTTLLYNNFKLFSITNIKFFIEHLKVVNLLLGATIMVQNLKKMRMKKGISQQQLADVIGVSQQSINKYENHMVEPDINTLMALADYFNTSVDYLIGHTDIDHVIETIQHYDLNDDEGVLIDGYRRLTRNEKESIRMIIRNYNENKHSR